MMREPFVLGAFLLCLGMSGCGAPVCCPAEVVDTQVAGELESAFAQERGFLRGAAGAWQASTDQAKGVPAPPDRVDLPAGIPRVALVPPDQFRVRDMSLVEAMFRRRSHRSFAASALDLETLSFLLWSGQGITDWATREDGSELGLRTTPSAGARYPIDLFVLVQRVEGVGAGLYRYLPYSHELAAVRVDEGVSREFLAACFDSPMIREASVVFVLGVVPYRTEWRYGKLAHRMIAMEAGHLVQNILLAVEATGLGGCAVGAYLQPGLDALMGFDGENTFTIYLAAVGALPVIEDTRGTSPTGGLNRTATPAP